MKTPDDLYIYEQIGLPIIEHLKSLPQPNGCRTYAWGIGSSEATVGVVFLRGEALTRVLAYLNSPEFNATIGQPAK